jgi:integrase
MHEKVDNFLDSRARNSKATKYTYKYGLQHFDKFLEVEGEKFPYGGLNIETILVPLVKKEIDGYALLDSFVSYLTKFPISNYSIISYMTSVKSYLQYYDIDILPYKYKLRVTVPKEYHEEEHSINQADIREILKACNNLRLKAYLYVLASCGARANEALARCMLSSLCSNKLSTHNTILHFHIYFDLS